MIREPGLRFIKYPLSERLSVLFGRFSVISIALRDFHNQLSLCSLSRFEKSFGNF